MYKLETTIKINAPSARVHEILCDWAKYPEWNPFFKAVTGSPDWTPRVGQSVILWMIVAFGKSIPVPATITSATPLTPAPANNTYVLRWGGGNAIVFKGDHYFICAPDPSDKNKTILSHGEIFSGFSTLPLGITGDFLLKGSYEALNRAVKKRAEEWRE